MRVSRWVAVVVAAVGVGAFVGPAVSAAEPLDYVAIGDSYAAGPRRARGTG